MEQNFNVNRSFNIFCDKLTSNNVGKDLIIESSYNSIDFCGNQLIFDGEVYFDRVICNNITISNISEISTKFLRVNSMTLPTEIKILYNSVNDGYIINTRVGINSGGIIGRSDAYFTYINVSGGDSSFNNSVYINKNLRVDGILTISNNLLISGNNFASIDNSFNIYKYALEQSFSSNKISTKDVSALKISISNELYVNKTAYINDLTISGQLLNNVLKVPNIFTIDPSGYNNHSGTLNINGDLIIKGATTSFSSSIVDICDQAIMLASNLVDILDLSNINAGLDISNIASLKYNGTLWNFSGGHLAVQNKKVLFIDDLSLAKRNFDLSLNTFRSDFSSSFFALKRNIDNSYNATYSRSQIDNSFILTSNFDLSLTSLRSYVDNSYISKNQLTISYGDILTLMDTSYVARGRVGAINSFTSSFQTFTDKLDISYLLNSVFEVSHNKIKTDFDNSFATINPNNISTSASAITIETINTKHDSQTFANSLWNQIGQDLSNGDPFNYNYNKVAISNDGRVVAFASSDFVGTTGAIEDSGGTITISGGYVIHRFDATGTFTPYFTGNVEVLLVGGGGGGGRNLGGGGGGGGVVYITSSYVTRGISYSVVVGSGGASGTNGENTTVFGATAAGGGTNEAYDYNGTIGGCGGGAGASQWTINFGGESSGNIIGINNGIANVGIIYGNRGGKTTTIRAAGGSIRAAGGGGAGGQGADTDTNSIGDRGQVGHGSGGIGISNPILGTSYYWGGGGGGSAYIDQSGGYGGYGGGGGGGGSGGGGIGGILALNNGSNGTITIGGAGGANTGGGGGGSGASGNLGGTGGSGIVVIRYLQSAIMYSKRRVYVYELSYNEASSSWKQLGLSSEIIVDINNDDQFGLDLALSSNGRIVAASSLYNDASAGQVRLFELSNTNRWFQKGYNINGPRPASESGYSISLAGNGNSIAIGAWKDNSNSGSVRVYDFSAGINDWRQQGQTISGVSGSFEGFATALSLDGQTLASSSGSSINNSGNITSYNEYIVHSFTNVGITVFTVINPITIDYLVVAGGGSGGVDRGGGGGAGGVLSGTTTLMPGSYNITVGAGGPSVINNQQGIIGGSSSISNLVVATGGGGGGGYSGGNGGNGGSGGGGYGGGATSGGTGINGQGFAGFGGGSNNGGGGGGAGAAASSQNGAIGISSSITGITKYYAGGGGGGTIQGIGGFGIAYGGIYQQANGLYGGGNGANTLTKQPFQDAAPNTGGGGGGQSGFAGTSGAGGSGIVIIRYVYQINNVKTFSWSGTTWINKGVITIPDISNSNFGKSMKLSANGNTIVIGAPGNIPTSVFEYNSSNFTIEQHTNYALNNGMTFASILNVEENEQVRQLLLSVGSPYAFIGGIRRPNSSASGITSADWQWVNGDIWSYTNFGSGEPSSTSEPNIHFVTSSNTWNDTYYTTSPAVYRVTQKFAQVYVYEHQGGTTWTQLGQTIQGIVGGDEFGSNVSMSNDGTIISVGSNNNNYNYNRGDIKIFTYANNYWYQLSNTINGKTSSSRAGIHALSGDGRTLIQSNNTYNRVYGVNRILSFTPSTTSNITTTISGGLIVGGKAYLNSLNIANRFNFDVSGYSSNYLASTDISGSIVDYYSNVGYTYNRVFRIDAYGNITNYSGLYGAISDSRLKENIVNCTPKLEDLLKVRVVNYNLKGGDTSKYIGVVAQELEEIFPELVTETNSVERFKSVNYSNLTILLIKAFQEQQVLINNLNASLEEVENEILKHKT